MQFMVFLRKDAKYRTVSMQSDYLLYKDLCCDHLHYRHTAQSEALAKFGGPQTQRSTLVNAEVHILLYNLWCRIQIRQQSGAQDTKNQLTNGIKWAKTCTNDASFPEALKAQFKTSKT